MSDTKIKIGENSKVNIKWSVLPIDYSHEKEDEIISKFAKKYGISKDNVKVTPQFISKNNNGESVPYVNDICDNIQNSDFQQKLFKDYLTEKGITEYNYDQIIEIDNTINALINYEVYEQHKRYAIKWVKWSNFMSYGTNNYFDFTTLDGLTLLTSEPANQGGKTTFCLDLFRFLLFGKVTSRESDWTLSKVFNKHCPEATEVVVEGCINIDGNDYIVKRTVSRPSLNKRTDKSKVSQKVNYYRLVNDEYIDLFDEECQEESNGRETNKAIKDAIGNERDFDLMICVDSDNLKGLISLKDTERGRLIARWIGLLPLEEKDKLAREKFNKEIMPKMMINRYNKEDLKTDIERYTNENVEYTKELKRDEKFLKESNNKIDENNKKISNLTVSKKIIDNSINNIDIETIKQSNDKIKEDGRKKREDKKNTVNRLNEIKEVKFNLNDYNKLVKDKEILINELASGRAKYKMLSNDIETLGKSEYCPTCGAKLKNVDNSEAIKSKTIERDNLTDACIKMKGDLEKVTTQISNMDSDRELYNEKSKLELLSDKLDVDIDNLLKTYNENMRLLKLIEDNKSAIEENNKIDVQINNSKAIIASEELNVKRLNESIINIKFYIKTNNDKITENKKIIDIINNEEEIIKSWKIYLELIGKNGISKMVLRTVLPLINGELKHLLSDVCDFTVEIVIDDHNDVAFYLIHDGVKSNLSSGSGFEQTVSSLALRSVLSKISSFSKPSFVVFDEILGGVAEENYDQVKKLYDKIVIDYQAILQITHNKNISEWHNKTIVVEKKNNISSIKAC